MMRRFLLLLYLLCGLSAQHGFSQPTSSAISFLETRLTRSIAPDYFVQYFRFADMPFPDGFSYTQAENASFAVYQVKLTQIKAMDIVAQDTTPALALTFHQPLRIILRSSFHGADTDTVYRQTLVFPLRNMKEAVYVQRALQQADSMLDFRMRKQRADKIYPEMAAIPDVDGHAAWIGRYPVTVQQYRTYCYDQEKIMPPAPPWGWHSDRPICGITPEEAKDYTAWLSETTGHAYDLPRKEVWQYLALDKEGGEGLLNDVAWWGENAEGITQPVGQKLPNSFGLYDMLGNVWEWLDEPKENGQYTAAGGSCDSHFEQCQWNSTAQWHANERDFNVGFRVLRLEQ